MEGPRGYLSCDGCGLPASPEHIAERVRRLELATRFRPIHIDVLFVSLAPPSREEDGFYGPPESGEFFTPFLEALGISSTSDENAAKSPGISPDIAHLLEFQRKGYYLVYLSECPRPEASESTPQMISRLAPSLIRRIQFNYKPKRVAILGSELVPLAELLASSGIGSLLTLNQGAAIPIPSAGEPESIGLFRNALAGALASDNLLSSGYDRIRLTQAERIAGAGGGS